LITLIFWAIILYVLWVKVFKAYYIFWHYWRQGAAFTSFPLPFLGNLLNVKKTFGNIDEYSRHPVI